LTKIYGYCLPTGFALHVSQRRSVIFRTSSNRGGNLRESRSRIYHISVSFSVGVKLYWTLHSSAFGVRPFIRSWNIDSGMSYAFAAPRTDNLLVVQSALIARAIRPSCVCIDILLWWRNRVSRLKRSRRVGKCAKRPYARDVYEPRYRLKDC